MLVCCEQEETLILRRIAVLLAGQQAAFAHGATTATFDRDDSARHRARERQLTNLILSWVVLRQEFQRSAGWDAPGSSFDRIQGGPSPADAPQLFRKDKHPDSGKPYCLRCRTTGHTLDVCNARGRNKGREEWHREDRGGFHRSSGQSQKRRRQ